MTKMERRDQGAVENGPADRGLRGEEARVSNIGRDELQQTLREGRAAPAVNEVTEEGITTVQRVAVNPWRGQRVEGPVSTPSFGEKVAADVVQPGNDGVQSGNQAGEVTVQRVAYRAR